MPDRQGRQPHRARGAIGALVAGAVAGLEPFDVHDARLQADRRPQIHGSGRAERRLGVDAEDGHTWSHHVQKAVGMLE